MNYTELLVTLAQRLQLSNMEVEKRLGETTAIIIAELIKSNVVSIENFGTLELKKKQERFTIHQDTGKEFIIPPKLIVKFNASDTFINKLKEMKP